MKTISAVPQRVKPPTKYSFCDYMHKLAKCTKLTDDFAEFHLNAESAPSIRPEVELYPHQKIVVQTLLDVEDKRQLSTTVELNNGIRVSFHPATIHTTALLLSEPFGSGKTIEILTLIAARPIPRAAPERVQLHQTANLSALQGEKRTKLFRVDDVVRKITTEFIPCNVIVVGSSVLCQWEEAIREFTTMTYMTVGNCHSLKSFYELYNTGKFAADILLVKAGTTTDIFKMAGTTFTTEVVHIIDSVRKITENKCFARVVYDDFDCIKLPTTVQNLRALFTVYASGSVKNVADMRRGTSRLERAYQYKITDAMNDPLLTSNFSIKCSDSLLEASTRMPFINVYKYMFKNHADNYAGLLGSLDEADSNQLVEMINGDAFGTAAKLLGIETKNISDIFRKILDKKYDEYMKYRVVLANIDKIRARHVKLLKKRKDHDDEAQAEQVYSAAEIEKFINGVTSSKKPELVLNNQLEAALDILKCDTEAKKLKITVGLNRIVDNIKTGECIICYAPIVGEDIVMMKCCGIVECTDCVGQGSKVNKRYAGNYGEAGAKAVVSGKCANCMSIVYPERDFIYLEKNFDVEGLLAACADNSATLEVEAAPVEIDDTPPKLAALMKIIRNEPIQHTKKNIDLASYGIMPGSYDATSGHSSTTARKVAVFAGWAESVTMIKNFLVEKGIQAYELGGTYAEKDRAVKKFRESESTSVLIINSSSNCAGMNLQFVSDIVFFHKILNSSVEGQVIGRGQRVGRTTNLKVHYLLYNNESCL